MKRKTFLALLLLTVIFPVFGQNLEYLRSARYFGTFEPIQRALNYAQVDGSPYLDEELIMGFVKFNHGDSAQYYLRYNIFTDEMEYLDDEKLYVIKNPNQVDRLFVNNHNFIYTTYTFRNSSKKGYLEELTTGYMSLYVKHSVDFEERKEPVSGYDKPTPDRFVSKMPVYYYAIDHGPIINFENDKTGLETLFQDDYPVIKNYLKSAKLKLRKQEDLVQLFNYYNSTR